eukprot:12891217-Alexandrium_andersonii.AAC.1
MVRALMPPSEAAAWDIVVPSRFREADEAAARPAVDWLRNFGPAAGVRVPSVLERARALGMGAYFEDLALPPLVAFNAQGNVFDRTALALRIADAVADWGNGVVWPLHAFPSPGVVL